MFEMKKLSLDDSKKRLEFLIEPKGEVVLAVEEFSMEDTKDNTNSELVIQLAPSLYGTDVDFEEMLLITQAALKVGAGFKSLGGAIHFKEEKNSLHIHLSFVDQEVVDEKIIEIMKDIWSISEEV